jgi:uncharacterized membrane protein YGL010W
MRSATTWFDLYAQSHQNPTNKAIHWLCIPLILIATLGLLQSIPHPFAAIPYLDWGALFMVVAMVFYATLSWTIFAGMLVIGMAALGINHGMVAMGLPLLQVSIGVWIAAWIVQFVGHKIEGAKPSFLEDVQYLLVGPAWLLQFVFQRVGIPVETHRAATVQ